MGIYEVSFAGISRSKQRGYLRIGVKIRGFVHVGGRRVTVLRRTVESRLLKVRFNMGSGAGSDPVPDPFSTEKSLEEYLDRLMYHWFMTPHPRIEREAKTVTAMIEIYCRDEHGTKSALCDDCRELNDYAMLRLSKCPFQEGKTTCGNCRVHCYKPEMRDKIKTVMRYSGRQMAYKHPVMSLRHLLDGRRKRPLEKGKR
jgi:hypothetical protein